MGRSPGDRDPRRSLLIGGLIAAVVLAVLLAVVLIGVFLVFSVRQDPKALAVSHPSTEPVLRFSSGGVLPLDCRHG